MGGVFSLKMTMHALVRRNLMLEYVCIYSSRCTCQEKLNARVCIYQAWGQIQMQILSKHQLQMQIQCKCKYFEVYLNTFQILFKCLVSKTDSCAVISHEEV